MKLYSKEELKDARIFFDKKPPNYMSVFIVFVSLCLVGTLIASVFVPKSYIINASGVATTDDNRYVSVDINGKIIEILKNEGDYVKTGDVLFKMSDGKENTQEKAIQPQIDTLKNTLHAMDVYESSLNSRTNQLENSGAQQAYYGKIELYLSTLNSESYTKNIDSTNLQKLQNELTTLQQEKDCLNTKLNNEKDDIKKQELQTKYETKNEEINAKQSEIEQSINSYNNPSSQAAQVYQQFISELGSERNILSLQLSQLEGQLAQLSDDKNLREVKAANDGVVHYLTIFKSGVSLQINQTVAEISTNESENYVIETNILAKDISKVKVGQSVSIELEGVNSQKYGTLKGKVEKISAGTLIEQTSQGNVVYYKCSVALKSTTLKSSNGEEISIVKSMPVQTRIIYAKETYYDWLKELINLKN